MLSRLAQFNEKLQPLTKPNTDGKQAIFISVSFASAIWHFCKTSKNKIKKTITQTGDTSLRSSIFNVCSSLASVGTGASRRIKNSSPSSWLVTLLLLHGLSRRMMIKDVCMYVDGRLLINCQPVITLQSVQVMGMGGVEFPK